MVLQRGWTALTFAVRIGNPETVKYLVETQGFDVNDADNVRASRMILVWRYALCHMTNALSQNGWTPFLHTIRGRPWTGDGCALAIVEHLVEQGADMNAKNKVGSTIALAYAVWHDRLIPDFCLLRREATCGITKGLGIVRNTAT